VIYVHILVGYITNTCHVSQWVVLLHVHIYILR